MSVVRLCEDVVLGVAVDVLPLLLLLPRVLVEVLLDLGDGSDEDFVGTDASLLASVLAYGNPVCLLVVGWRADVSTLSALSEATLEVEAMGPEIASARLAELSAVLMGCTEGYTQLGIEACVFTGVAPVPRLVEELLACVLLSSYAEGLPGSGDVTTAGKVYVTVSSASPLFVGLIGPVECRSWPLPPQSRPGDRNLLPSTVA